MLLPQAAPATSIEPTAAEPVSLDSAPEDAENQLVNSDDNSASLDGWNTSRDTELLPSLEKSPTTPSDFNTKIRHSKKSNKLFSAAKTNNSGIGFSTSTQIAGDFGQKKRRQRARPVPAAIRRLARVQATADERLKPSATEDDYVAPSALTLTPVPPDPNQVELPPVQRPRRRQANPRKKKLHRSKQKMKGQLTPLPPTRTKANRNQHQEIARTQKQEQPRKRTTKQVPSQPTENRFYGKSKQPHKPQVERRSKSRSNRPHHRKELAAPKLPLLQKQLPSAMLPALATSAHQPDTSWRGIGMERTTSDLTVTAEVVLDLSIHQLQQELKARGLPAGGRKSVMIERLKNALYVEMSAVENDKHSREEDTDLDGWRSMPDVEVRHVEPVAVVEFEITTSATAAIVHHIPQYGATIRIPSLDM
jgi:hypothetical protein